MRHGNRNFLAAEIHINVDIIDVTVRGVVKAVDLVTITSAPPNTLQRGCDGAAIIGCCACETRHSSLAVLAMRRMQLMSEKDATILSDRALHCVSNSVAAHVDVNDGSLCVDVSHLSTSLLSAGDSNRHGTSPVGSGGRCMKYPQKNILRTN